MSNNRDNNVTGTTINCSPYPVKKGLKLQEVMGLTDRNRDLDLILRQSF